MELLQDKNYYMTVHELRSKRVEPFGAVIERLKARKSQIKIIRAARKSGLSKDDRLKTLQCVFSDGAYCSTVIEILSEELPLSERFDDEMNEEGDYYLAIDPGSFSMWTWDDANDQIASVEGSAPWFSLTVFLLLLNMPLMDEDLPEYWNNCIEYFGWPFTEPLELARGVWIDEEYLKGYLQRRHLLVLYRAVEQAYFPPENAFLNCNIEDEGSIYIEFNAENLKMLRSDWKKAKPYLKQFDLASEMVAKDAGLLKILYDGLRKSQIAAKKKLEARVRVRV